MAEKEKTESAKSEPKKEPGQDTSKNKVRVIPTVPKDERIYLNEGVDRDSDKNKKGKN